MSKEIRNQLVAAALGLGVGVLGTYAMVWRDVAVIKAELSHIKEDVNTIQKFIADDDPRAWLAAKDAIRAEHAKDNQ
jgi:hypothetical protein